MELSIDCWKLGTKNGKIKSEKKFHEEKVKLHDKWCLFFGWLEKIKILDFFFYSIKSNLLLSIKIIKVNLLSIDLN